MKVQLFFNSFLFYRNLSNTAFGCLKVSVIAHFELLVLMLKMFKLRRLNELEDIVAEQDNSLAALRDKLSKSRQETQEWKLRHGEAMKQAADEKQRQVIILC